MVETILFDLDDTLYPEIQFVISGFKAVSKYLSEKYDIAYDTIFDILKKDFENGIRRKNFDILLKKIGIENKIVDDLVKIYRNHIPQISMYPDAKKILVKLKGKYKMGLISDGYPTTQYNKIKVLDIKKFFDLIIINDISKGISKKNSNSFSKALYILETSSKGTIYVGDNPLKDISMPKKLGIHTVIIRRDNGIHRNVNGIEEAEYIISDLIQLLDVINSIERIR